MLQHLRAAAAADPSGRRSAALRAALLRQLSADRPLSIALYAPLPHEVDLLPLLREAPQHRYAFPRCLPEHQLCFHLVSNPTADLIPGAMGIPTPRPELPILRPDETDLLIVPGLAFTAGGERLGYGGGYYDRFIPRCRAARIAALAFPEQMLEALPTEPHDFRIPEIIQIPC